MIVSILLRTVRDKPQWIALNDQDPAVRIESIGHLEGCADEDPQAEAFLSHLAHHDLDPHEQKAALEALARRQQ